MNYSERLKKAMDFRGISASELSLKSGVAKSLISKYLKGITKPKSDKIVILAKALDVSPGYLMGIGDDMITLVSKIDSKDFDNEKRLLLNEAILTLEKLNASQIKKVLKLIQAYIEDA